MRMLIKHVSTSCIESDRSCHCQVKWQSYQMLQQVYDFVQKHKE